MKKVKKQKKRIVPTFATEAEESQWWHENREAHKHLLAAVKSGEAQGLPYQTYIKSLLHETLSERENLKPGY